MNRIQVFRLDGSFVTVIEPTPAQPSCLAANDAGLFVVCENTCVGFSLTGQRLFEFSTGEPSSIAATSGEVIVCRTDALHVFDSRDGSLLRVGQIPESFFIWQLRGVQNGIVVLSTSGEPALLLNLDLTSRVPTCQTHTVDIRSVSDDLCAFCTNDVIRLTGVAEIFGTTTK
jgi:hypothetical protein